MIVLRFAIFFCSAGLLYTQDLNDCNNFPFPASVVIKEDVPIGHVVFSVGADPNVNTTTYKWELESSKSSFDLTVDEDGYYTLKTRQSLDTFVGCLKEDTTVLSFKCQTQSQSTSVIVQFVGKEGVYFEKNKLPKVLTISEDTSVGHPFLNLNNEDYYKDDDCYFEHVVSLESATTGDRFDAKRYIGINETTNELILKKKFAYDEERCQFNANRNLTLRMSVRDETESNPSHEYYTMTVTLVDVDNEPPVFVKQGCVTCIKKCKVTARSINLQLHYDKHTFFKDHIDAKDFDTPNATLHYDIVTVDPDYYHDLFDLDLYTGELSINISANDLTNSTDFYGEKNILIVLQVINKNESQSSEYFNLTINFNVERPKPDESGNNSTENDDNSKDLSITILIVIFVIVGVALLVFVSITVIRIKRSPKSSQYKFNEKYSEGEVTEGYSNGVIAQSENSNSQKSASYCVGNPEGKTNDRDKAEIYVNNGYELDTENNTNKEQGSTENNGKEGYESLRNNENDEYKYTSMEECPNDGKKEDIED